MATAAAVKQALINAGFGEVAATNLTAVFGAESNYNTTSQGAQSTETPGALNPSGAYGLASWNGDRQQGLKDFASSKGLNPGSLDAQAGFAFQEASSGPFAVNTQTGSISDFVTKYERPANTSKEIAAATKLSGQPGGSPDGSTPSGTKDCAGGQRVPRGTAPTPPAAPQDGGDKIYDSRMAANSTLSDLQTQFPNDPSLGGLYPSSNTWGDTVNDVHQDYVTNTLSPAPTPPPRPAGIGDTSNGMPGHIADMGIGRGGGSGSGNSGGGGAGGISGLLGGGNGGGGLSGILGGSGGGAGGAGGISGGVLSAVNGAISQLPGPAGQIAARP